MRPRKELFIVLTMLLTGCASSHQGMKLRAQAPAIDEAFRKVSLAVSADGYTVERVDPRQYTIETGWRDLKDKEKSSYDVTLPSGSVQSRILLRLEPRGRLYDVFLTPMLKYSGGAEQKEIVADVQHPLWEKWRKAVGTLVETEFKEED